MNTKKRILCVCLCMALVLCVSACAGGRGGSVKPGASGDVAAEKTDSNWMPENKMPIEVETIPFIGTGWTAVEATQNGETLDTYGSDSTIEFYNQHDAGLTQGGSVIKVKYKIDRGTIAFSSEDGGVLYADIIDGRISIGDGDVTAYFENTYTVDTYAPDDYAIYIIYPLTGTEWKLVSVVLDSGETLSVDGSISFIDKEKCIMVIADLIPTDTSLFYAQYDDRVSIDLPKSFDGVINGDSIVFDCFSIADGWSGTYTFERVY